MENSEQIKPGQRFDRLLVIGSTFNQDHGVTLWHCQCDCGNTVNVLKFTQPIDNRFERKVISCGCQPWVNDFETHAERRERQRRENPRPVDQTKTGRRGKYNKVKKAAMTSNRLYP